MSESSCVSEASSQIIVSIELNNFSAESMFLNPALSAISFQIMDSSTVSITSHSLVSASSITNLIHVHKFISVVSLIQANLDLTGANGESLISTILSQPGNFVILATTSK
jgi:hypothetical protein